MGYLARRAFWFGTLEIEHNGQEVLGIRIVQGEAQPDTSVLSRLVFEQMEEYACGKRKDFSFPYVLRGTPFQQKVWNAICAIPYGKTQSYGQIAEKIGSPRAARAVGMAANRNPIMIAVPCHRVIGADGTLVGYGGGLPMKKALLDLESRHSRK
ncbi:methylated-DNA--[protein]-cysteine S-methyltransferase [Ructibacterium gallinarum]|uniref:Methylated-DNA--protein-cysteine methyltransferase n=1 Tax=Ructibacterium gallinarum TaxID=2779355 RepID=A0A9D5LZX2_9FIRM|nr:methylated-DNA--[protein]-cysteine S-methyltransferase [Ructibacterium gallinarum]MBE5038888.1 methylated-DNA--[protein]-cysteine S-methyltransferase [Ructibacterium gallinarum]